jgi:hypothetical protein
MSQYEEVVFHDENGDVEYSYVERVVDTGPDPDEPPDGYYDEADADDPWQEHECPDCVPGVTKLPVGVYDSRGWGAFEFSDEPPF